MLTEEAKKQLKLIRKTWRERIAAPKLNTASDHLLLALARVAIISTDLKLTPEETAQFLEKRLRQTFTASNTNGFKKLKELLRTFGVYMLGTHQDAKITHLDSYIDLNKGQIAPFVNNAIKMVANW